jgi:hypothetical protein
MFLSSSGTGGSRRVKAEPPRGNGAGDAQEEVVGAILRGVCEKLTGGVGQVVYY